MVIRNVIKVIESDITLLCTQRMMDWTRKSLLNLPKIEENVES